MNEKTDSKGLSLVTTSILGQAPSQLFAVKNEPQNCTQKSLHY